MTKTNIGHTPGPWTLEQNRNDDEFTSIGEPIAIIGGKETGEPIRFTVGRTCDFGPHGSEQTTANAKLIAAAPKLLEACQQAIREIERLYTGQPVENFESNDTVIFLRKAIEKAIGGL